MPRGSRTTPAQSERQLEEAVVQLARALGWLVYHTYDSRRSAEGFPDLVLVRQGELIFAELKSETGQVSPAQRTWLDELAAAPRFLPKLVPVYVWQPSDWPEIERTLR